ncbi:hypothetical protein ABPG75_011964 [Micractinium tetrahymenae]
MVLAAKGPDVLDQTVAFLAKREGIDKTLKIIRYTTRLLLAMALRDSGGGELAQRLKRFEGSIATSRKAYRLGKFLGDVNTLRKTRLHAPYAALEWIAAGGECVYYFTDQLIWLVKAGLLPDRYGRSLGKVSAWGEFIGYLGSITLSLLRIALLLEREAALLAELQRQRALAERQRRKQASAAGAESLPLASAAGAGGGSWDPAATAGPTQAAQEGEQEAEGGGSAKALAAEISQLRARRTLRTLGLVQDLADLLMVLPEIRGQGSKPGRLGAALSGPAVLALAGLASGCLSAYKNWPGAAR